MDFIRLLDSSEEKVMDSVATTYEDSFCLEEFGDLIKAHAALAKPDGQQRCFIIARVQTWDHKQPDKEFYSYYDAFQLNKILFQTQVYLGKKLIHRIHVLNPLTNTDIIGNVLYFMVKPRPAAAPAPAEVLSSDKASVRSHSSTSGTVSKTAMIARSPSGSIQSNPYSPGYGMPLPASPVRGERDVEKGQTMPRPSLIDTSTLRTRGLYANNPPSAHVADAERGVRQSWTMATQAVTLLREDDERNSSSAAPSTSPLFQAARRVSIKAGATARKLSAAFSPLHFQPISETSTSAVNSPPASAVGEATIENRGRTRTQSLYVRKSAPMAAPVAPAKRMSVSQVEPHAHGGGVVVKTPTTPIQINNHLHNKTEIPKGTVTRFAVPVPQYELPKVAPPTPKGRRRALSHNNSSNKALPFDEWARQVRQAELAAKQQDVVKANASLTATPAAGVPGALVTVYSDLQLDVGQDATAEPERASKMPPAPSAYTRRASLGASVTSMSANTTAAAPAATTTPNAKRLSTDYDTYDAVLFATDNDFLESSKTRAIFRENAVSPEDAKIFEMPPYTGEGQDMPLVIFIDDSPLCESCYPSPQRLADMSPSLRLFHQAKCYMLILLFASGVIFFIINALKTSGATSGQGSASGGH
ncbi:hypothetical protein RI367_005747 [Sorochytrium milnesiophthora]